jgi:hypothetical protein
MDIALVSTLLIALILLLSHFLNYPKLQSKRFILIVRSLHPLSQIAFSESLHRLKNLKSSNFDGSQYEFIFELVVEEASLESNPVIREVMENEHVEEYQILTPQSDILT